MRLQLLGLLLLALAIRGGVLAVATPAETLAADVDGYRWLAESLAEHQLFGSVDAEGRAHPTAFRPPLYPWLLSWLVWGEQLNDHGVRALHLLLGLLAVGGTYWLGRRLLDEKSALAAGFLVAIDPILLVQSTQVMTETLAAALAVAVWMIWVALFRDRPSAADSSGRAARGRIALLSVLLAVSLTAAFFCRPTFLIWAALLCGYAVLVAFRRRVLWPLFSAVVVATLLSIAIGAWAYRNQRALGHPVWATSHGGYTLLLGNNPPFYDYLREGSFGVAWDAQAFHQAWTMRYESDPRDEAFWRLHADAQRSPPHVEDEIADDRLAHEAARATIRRQPAMFAWACVVRVGRLWSPWPLATAERTGWSLAAVAIFYCGLFLLVLAGCVRWGRQLLQPAWVAGILLAVALTAVHLVYWSNMRMRAPATPLLALVAAAAITRRPD